MTIDSFTPAVKYAILVGGREKENPELNLGVASLVRELDSEFVQRGFITVPMSSFVTAERIENSLGLIERLCNNARRLPTILFYYAGHQNHEGLCLEDGIYSREKLMRQLSRIRGDKLGIFDCCFAGLLRQYAERNLTILAATAEDRAAYASMHPGENSMKTILGREIHS